MKITPLDIRRKEFKRSVRGYSDEEVDIFLDEVADEFERLFQENIDLGDKVHRLQEQAAGYAQVKEALEKTLITAQLQSEEMKTNAHKESELILRDAEFKARGIINDSYGETQRVQQTLVQLKLLEEDFRFKFRSLLEGYLKLLEEAPLSTATAEAAAAETPGAQTPTASETAAVKPVLKPVEGETRVTPAATDAPATAPTAAPAASPQPVSAPATAPTAEPRPASVPVPPPGVSPGAPPRPQGADARPATPPVDDDSPTQENERAVAHVNAAVDAFAAAQSGLVSAEDSTEEVTIETRPARRAHPEDATAEDDGSAQGFFFGRHFDDFDGTFPPDDAVKKDKARDFEW